MSALSRRFEHGAVRAQPVDLDEETQRCGGGCAGFVAPTRKCDEPDNNPSQLQAFVRHRVVPLQCRQPVVLGLSRSPIHSSWLPTLHIKHRPSSLRPPLTAVVLLESLLNLVLNFTARSKIHRLAIHRIPLPHQFSGPPLSIQTH
ncbi:hypothetical protein Ae201684P_012623 [Aphanomyces euteiches]|uniref:Uncharacterized protein n=1 Tax=Aphanomyces euteiches TaxID=100861 RepID=A0A6G0WYU6_9STRA|nr:hypothetical protein Ae201684_010116 [Aphanomyces euteiches]KAH9076135.1 hypothetical protein Ae201684P_012623 [Aphanomyces euteiches]